MNAALWGQVATIVGVIILGVAIFLLEARTDRDE